MTVKELIDHLSFLPPTSRVFFDVMNPLSGSTVPYSVDQVNSGDGEVWFTEVRES